MSREILSVVQLVSREKSLPREKIFEALETALTIATKKQYIHDIDVRVSIDRNNGDINTFRRWMIVDYVINPEREITLQEARYNNQFVQISEFIENKIKSIDFDRISTQEAKQIIINKVREVERCMISNKFHDYKGKIIQGTVKKINHDFMILDVGNSIEAIFLKRDLLPKENWAIGDRVRGVLYEIRSNANGVQLFLSRSRAEMLIELFRIEVPEINRKLIIIQAIAREPGIRSKVAVKTTDKIIDPVGACVGMRGARVQSVSKEMSGERIDVILWSNDPAQFVINAMAPVRVVSVIIHKNVHAMDIIIKSKNLAQAIGRNGQNIRLAAQLCGWELNIMTINDLQNRSQSEINKIRALFNKFLNLNNRIINILIYSGFSSLPELVCTPCHVLMKIQGMNFKIIHAVQEQADNCLTYSLITGHGSFFDRIF
ncbi:transcription termination factor NusA [Buchnera aphidicola]|uniref:Transcription termination/antitermination protein NusA n=1 Tax=Buchnera aphidicola (Sarucallis kahawaluokalani) TaxID=1241878 RepID=A0A4D6YM20_9GAMM|nr:transcription termination factor NusA [Buchnera aphidicola]QCI26045.1 transcription termination/antitermination protein NusA [Buchnera aphidicola (Sarucallis kahawaluokalani)]